ncbi:MAG TPA: hypothetical protein PKL67_08365 [Anaerolineae bacterium]|nr:hypothetical protein [Anaerolineae bacterium]
MTNDTNPNETPEKTEEEPRQALTPLVWVDERGKIGFAPMTVRAMQQVINALQEGRVTP